MRRAIVAVLAVCFAIVAGCTLLNSRDGLEGPDDGGIAGDGTSGPDGTGSQDGGDGGFVVDAGDAHVPSFDAAAVVTLYDSQTLPLGITVDGEFLYWVVATTPNRGILKAPRAGPTAGSIVHVDDVGDPIGQAFDVVVDGTYVYFGDLGSGTVSKKPLAGGNHVKCFDGSISSAYLAIGGGAIYATDFFTDPVHLDAGAGSVVAGACDGGSQAIYTSQARASGIAVGSVLYWGRTSPDQIASGGFGGGGAGNELTPTVGVVGGVAIDGQGIYWIEGNQRVMRFDNATRKTTKLYEAAAPFGDCDIAVDDQAVYWTESANGLIRKLPK